MQVHQIDLSNARDVKRFIQFPFELYRTCPVWVPPLVRDMRLALNPNKHPFYLHSTAGYFVVQNRNETLGRIAVLDNHYYNQYQHCRMAFFTYFDAVDDAQVTRELFAAAEDWARRRRLNEIAGPRGLLASDAVGMLVEGFEHRPAMGIAYNYPYYENLVLQNGYVKFCDNFSGYLPGNHQLEPRLYQIAERVRERRGFWIKSFSSKSEMVTWVPRAVEIVNEAFSTFGREHFPVPREEVDIASKTIVDVADPRLVKLVMKDQEIAGFIFSYHDISAALQKARGRIWPFGWLYLLTEARRTKWVNINGLGLLPKYQGLGANAVLYTALADTLHPFGFEHADVVAVDETNDKSRSDMETMGVRWYKRHRYYTKQI
jgi:GNAT superfamily N-acetyltransferase